ncbi:MAG: 4Fe-4S binding protein [Deltaproteobacteria bacterium]|nr:4Fe-4S binding protein [Deltaproteobacteria bacterium]
MKEDIYRKVQRQLDRYSIGFPETESGIEIEILKLCFTEEEAELFAELTGELETPQSVAGRLNRPEEEMAAELEKMAAKGLLYRYREGESVKYSAIPFIHGLLEFQALWEPKDLIRLTGKYIREKLHQNLSGAKSMRVLPIRESLDVKHRIATFDDACEILKKEDFIAVADCSCRIQRKPFGKACDNPIETCIMVGPMAHYYIENKMGRPITLDEALKILEECHEAGLVMQTQAVTKPFMICNCCKCCCGFLGNVKNTDNPAELVISNHRAVLDKELCTGCSGLCVDRCQVDAIRINSEGLAEIDYKRCIGCGVCAPVCPVGAISLVPKPAAEQVVPTETLHQQGVRMAENRGIADMDEKHVITWGYE